jgi:thiamine biosynthesis protein ThiS
MKVIINGDDCTFESPLTLAGLVQLLGMKTDRVAVELNSDIVPRDRWDQTQLADGDRLEIVHFVGGGLF